MEDSSELFRRPEVQRLMQALRDGLIEKLRPEFSHKNIVTYPDAMRIMDIQPSQTREVLDRLASAGILIKKLADVRLSCPSCASIGLSLRPECPNCGSSLIKKGETIEHLICGHVDFLKSFTEPGGFVCPKCRRSLKSLGLDYRKPGSFYKCQSCGDLTSNTKKRFTCGACGHEFLEGEEGLAEAYIYRVNEEKKALLEKECIDLKPMIEKMKAMGWDATASGYLEGTSGVKHAFALIASNLGEKADGGKPNIVGDIVIGEKLADEPVILSTFAKAYDVGVKLVFLVTVPGLTEQAKRLAKFYNINVLESTSPGSAVDVLWEAVQKLIRQPDTKDTSVLPKDMNRLKSP
jgi:predicted RNA-binding Zn-ribbon protein involved in translation (DUF1610 family)